MKPKLIPNWKKTLRRAWSVRFSALSSICSAGEVIVTYFPDKLPRGVMAGLAMFFAIVGGVSRFIMQRNLREDD